MKILLDADGSPVRKEVVKVAEAFSIPLIIISNVNHMIDEPYGTIIQVDQSQDSADYKIISMAKQHDLIITQDYGLASLALSKNAYAMHQDGWFFTENNIETLLSQRHLAQKVRQSKGRIKGNKKRLASQNATFEKALKQFIQERISR